MSVRILSGQFKGSVLSVPSSARPTLIRSRQSLFDILASQAITLSGFERNSENSETAEISKNSTHLKKSNPKDFFENKVVLDCFAGSGALGIEALSRGASFAYFTDISQDAISVIYENIGKLKLGKRCRIIKTDILKIRKFNEVSVCDIVFIDPPYGKVSIKKTLQRLLKTNWINEDSLIVTEEDISKTENLSDTENTLIEKKSGKSLFRIMKLNPSENSLSFAPRTDHQA